jgi:hypothetical protein
MPRLVVLMLLLMVLMLVLMVVLVRVGRGQPKVSHR